MTTARSATEWGVTGFGVVIMGPASLPLPRGLLPVGCWCLCLPLLCMKSFVTIYN